MAIDIMKPQLSRVAKTTQGLICTIYGLGGTGKTPVACKMPKPLYLAFGKSGLSGLNNVPFFSIKSWAEFKSVNKQLCNQSKFDEMYEAYNTIVMDEMEILYSYCEKYVANSEGVNKIKEGNGGYGLWGDLKTEWETEMLRLIGSGFCVMFILHTSTDDNGRQFPVGDTKRMLPILINHSEIIGYVRGNGVNQDTGKPIHSSLVLAASDECFARTRNEYFDPIIEDFTADNLVKAYYDAVERQSKVENVTPITNQERDAMFETEKVDFNALMAELQETGEAIIEKFGAQDGRSRLTEIVEAVLGKGALVSKCTEKQTEAVQVILMDLKAALNE